MRIKDIVLLLQRSFYDRQENIIMRITILQTDIKWAQPEDNMVAAERMVSHAPVSDLYVLPEMWSTGFITDTTDLDNGKKALDWMKTTAERLKCAICGSIAYKIMNGEYANRLFFVKPDGDTIYYDKRHLFTYGGEDKCYIKGEKRVIVKYNGIKFLLQTCYDLRFPIWMRNHDDYDAIILSANWPESRQNVWQLLLRARAIENQCYVIGANRTGCDLNNKYIGRSAVIDAKGRTLAQAKANGEQTITADIDIEKLNLFRQKFPVYKDSDIVI